MCLWGHRASPKLWTGGIQQGPPFLSPFHPPSHHQPVLCKDPSCFYTNDPFQYNPLKPRFPLFLFNYSFTLYPKTVLPRLFTQQVRWQNLSVGTILGLKKFFLAAPGLSFIIWDPVPWPGIEPGIKPGPPALGAQSLNHWTTREVPLGFLETLNSNQCSHLLQPPPLLPFELKCRASLWCTSAHEEL